MDVKTLIDDTVKSLVKSMRKPVERRFTSLMTPIRLSKNNYLYEEMLKPLASNAFPEFDDDICREFVGKYSDWKRILRIVHEKTKYVRYFKHHVLCSYGDARAFIFNDGTKINLTIRSCDVKSIRILKCILSDEYYPECNKAAAVQLKSHRMAKYALLVGACNKDLKTVPIKDCKTMEKILTKNGFYCYTPDMTKANIFEINQALKQLKEVINTIENSMVLFYFAGIGITHRGCQYLIDVDYGIGSLNEVLRTIESFKKLSIVIVDCCRDYAYNHDDFEIKNNNEPTYPSENQYLLYGSAYGFRAYQSKDGGYFTNSLADAIEQMVGKDFMTIAKQTAINLKNRYKRNCEITSTAHENFVINVDPEFREFLDLHPEIETVNDLKLYVENID